MAEEILAAWMGGSFSPPTMAHVNVIVAIGAKLKELSPGKQAYVCVVPVSQAYKKCSIECISLDDRLRIIHAFIVAIREEALKQGITPEDVIFRLYTYEMTAPTGVLTADSLTTLNGILQGENPGKTIKLYLAQGQDNIEKIFEGPAGGWKKTEELMNYPLLMFPRGQDAIKKPSRNNLNEKGKEKLYNSIKAITRINNSKAKDSADAKFMEETSSSLVRKQFREGNFSAAFGTLHPFVSLAIKSLPKNPYTEATCEPPCDRVRGGARKNYTIRKRRLH
jgi:nicotinic acid mononucleotide adenylyltransferase